MTEVLNDRAVLHVRFDGRRQDLRLGDRDLGPRAGDGVITQALARFLEVPEARLRAYVVDRPETGNLTVRPEAVFG